MTVLFFLTDLVLAIIVSWGLKIGKDSFSKKITPLFFNENNGVNR